MKGKSVLFVHEIPVKEVKANLIQTLNMCLAFAKKNVKVKLLLLTSIEIEDAKSTIEQIIPSYDSFFEIKFIPYQTSRNYFTSGDRFKILKQYIDFSFDYIFTRSPFTAIYASKKSSNIIYESHNSYFSKNTVLNYYFNFKFRL